MKGFCVYKMPLGSFLAHEIDFDDKDSPSVKDGGVKVAGPFKDYAAALKWFDENLRGGDKYSDKPRGE